MTYSVSPFHIITKPKKPKIRERSVLEGEDFFLFLLGCSGERHFDEPTDERDDDDDDDPRFMFERSANREQRYKGIGWEVLGSCEMMIKCWVGVGYYDGGWMDGPTNKQC